MSRSKEMPQTMQKDWDDAMLRLKKLKGIEKIKIVQKP